MLTLPETSRIVKNRSERIRQKKTQGENLIELFADAVTLANEGWERRTNGHIWKKKGVMFGEHQIHPEDYQFKYDYWKQVLVDALEKEMDNGCI